MNARNRDLSALVVGVNAAITKTNGDRIAGRVSGVLPATRAQGLRYSIERNAVIGNTVVEALDIAEFFLF